MIRDQVDLGPFFAPQGVALIGSVDRTLDESALRATNDDRWGGDSWHLVNPRGGSVGSIPIHTSVGDIARPVTLAVLSTPAAACADIIRECGAAGVPFALVFSSGFSEVGGAGTALEADLARAGTEAGVRIIGPNTNTNAFERFPDAGPHHGGRIAVVSQSGHNGRPIVQGADLGLRFSRLVPTGNEVDIDVCDIIEYFATEPTTAVIAAYVEGFRDAARLDRALTAAIETDTPIVMMKIGSSEAGARMARTHTGHLVGSDAIVQSIFDRFAVTRVRDLDELLETSALFAKLPRGTGPSVALYSISGGSGTLMAEQAELHGVPLATFSDETHTRLRRHIPDHLTVANPVDNGGTFVMTQPSEVRREVMTDMLADPDVDMLVVGVTGAVAPMTDILADDIAALAQETDKPIIVTWNSPRIDEDGYRTLVASGVPFFRSFRGCFGALSAFAIHGTARAGFRHRAPTGHDLGADEVDDPSLDDTALDDTALLDRFGIPVVPQRLALAPNDVAGAILGLGPSLAMKIQSPDIGHKSDLGLVRVDVAPEEAPAVHADLIDRVGRVAHDADVDGVVIQPMVSGVEMIVGVISDPILGPAVVVGTGGIHAEVLDDRAIRPVPLDRRDAEEMVGELRGHVLLTGYRGSPPADVAALVDTILRVSQLAEALGEELLELDLNPVVVAEQGHGAVAVDYLLVRRHDKEPHDH